MKKIISTILAGSILTTCLGLVGCEGKSKTLKWVQLGDINPACEKVIAKANEIIEPELGMKLEIEYLDSASFSEKAKMKMAANETFDIIWTGYLNDYQNAVSLGGLKDITEYIDDIKMSDGTVAKMSDAVEEYLLDSAKVDGAIYGIPNTQVVSNPLTMKVRKSVADECKIDVDKITKYAQNCNDPESAKEYVKVLDEEFAKAKEKRPDLITFNPGTNVASYGIYEEIVKGVGIRKDGTSTEVVNIRDTEEHKIGVDAVRDWNVKGYISSEIASKGNALVSVDEEKQYAFTQTTWKPGQDVQDANEMGEEVVYPLSAVPYIARTNPLATMLSVGANSKHPKEAVKLIYMLNSNKDLYNLLVWGIEGENYKKNDDGTVSDIKDSGYDEVYSTGWRYGNQFNSYILQGQSLDVWEETRKMNDEAVKSPALGFVPDTNNITTELGNITNVIAEYKAKEEFGTASRDEYWDEYMGKLKAAGIEKVINEIQSQYDQFLAEK